MPHLACSLAEGPVFIFLSQPSAAGIPMCGQWAGWLEEASVLFEALGGQSCPCDSHASGSSRFSFHESCCCDFPTQSGKHYLTNAKGRTAAWW